MPTPRSRKERVCFETPSSACHFRLLHFASANQGIHILPTGGAPVTTGTLKDPYYPQLSLQPSIGRPKATLFLTSFSLLHCSHTLFFLFFFLVETGLVHSSPLRHNTEDLFLLPLYFLSLFSPTLGAASLPGNDREPSTIVLTVSAEILNVFFFRSWHTHRPGVSDRLSSFLPSQPLSRASLATETLIGTRCKILTGLWFPLSGAYERPRETQKKTNPSRPSPRCAWRLMDCYMIKTSDKTATLDCTDLRA